MTEITSETLMAYVDGQLSPEAAARVEAYLDAHPDAAADVAMMQRQNDGIKTLFGAQGIDPIPDRLDPHKLTQRLGHARREVFLRAAMVTLIFGLGLVAGWVLRPLEAGPQTYERLIANAVSAHSVYVAETRHAVEVVGTESEHLSTWLSHRLETKLAMPDLSDLGLSFVGGRLLPAPDVAGGRAAQLMYEDAAGERLTLYITPSTGVDGPEVETVSFGLDTAVYWADPVFTCTLVGPQTEEEMQPILARVADQLSPQPGQRVYRDL